MDFEASIYPFCDTVDSVHYGKGKDKVVIDGPYLRKVRERNSISEVRDYPKIVLSKKAKEKNDVCSKKTKTKAG